MSELQAHAPAADADLLGPVLADADDATPRKREGVHVLRGPEGVGAIGEAQIVRQDPKRAGGRAWVYAEYVSAGGAVTRIPFAAVPSIVALLTDAEIERMGLMRVTDDVPADDGVPADEPEAGA